MDGVAVAFAEGRPVQRTRAALFDAFVELVLEKRYDQVKVADIIARAQVGRSTFYEHYRGKNELLKEGISVPFRVLADMITDRHDEGRLVATVVHFWTNRRVANVLFSGSTRALVTRTLAGLFEVRLLARGRHCGSPLPPALLASQIAGGQIALISAWLAGQASAPPRIVADALYESANVLLVKHPRTAR